LSLLDLFGKDANFFGGRTSEQRARGAGQIAYESIPGISEAVTFRDIKSELSKDNPNWYAIGLLGGAGVLGLIPFIGDIAGSAIRQGVKARNIVSRKMLTASQKQAQDILDLLKSGKANEVTDRMLANADQKYLFENYDLPMDTQSRLERAKGMGLLDDSFHGTTSAKTAQDGIKKPGGRLFSSSSPEVANTYGDNIYPLKIRKQDSSMTLDAKGRNWSRIPDPFDEMYSPDKTNFSVDTLTTLPSLSTDIDMSGGKSLTVKNVVDAGAFHTGNPKSYKPSTVTVSHMKNNPLVRSRFARFDPRLKNLKNLSAGFIPIGLLPFLMNEEQQ